MATAAPDARAASPAMPSAEPDACTATPPTVPSPRAVARSAPAVGEPSTASVDTKREPTGDEGQRRGRENGHVREEVEGEEATEVEREREANGDGPPTARHRSSAPQRLSVTQRVSFTQTSS